MTTKLTADDITLQTFRHGEGDTSLWEQYAKLRFEMFSKHKVVSKYSGELNDLDKHPSTRHIMAIAGEGEDRKVVGGARLLVHEPEGPDITLPIEPASGKTMEEIMPHIPDIKDHAYGEGGGIFVGDEAKGLGLGKAIARERFEVANREGIPLTVVLSVPASVELSQGAAIASDRAVAVRDDVTIRRGDKVLDRVVNMTSSDLNLPPMSPEMEQSGMSGPVCKLTLTKAPQSNTAISPDGKEEGKGRE